MDTVTIKEAADLAKVNPVTVRRWIKAGKLAATKAEGETGEVWRIDAESLAALIGSESETSPTGDSAAVLAERVRGLEALIEAKDETIDQLRKQLQAREEEARAMIATTAQLTAKALPPRRPSFWDRLTNRSKDQ